MLYVVGGSRIWGYISPPPVIRKQPHKATWAEVLGHHLCITRILILFHGRTSQPRPSLELGVCFLPCLPPCFPSLPPCPSLFLQLFAVVVVVFLTAKKKKKGAFGRAGVQAGGLPVCGAGVRGARLRVVVTATRLLWAAEYERTEQKEKSHPPPSAPSRSPKEGYWAPSIPDNPSAIAQATVTGSWRACGEREREREGGRERSPPKFRPPLASPPPCFSYPGSPNGLSQTHVLLWSSCSTPFQLVTSTQKGMISPYSSKGAETAVCVCMCIFMCAEEIFISSPFRWTVFMY